MLVCRGAAFALLRIPDINADIAPRRGPSTGSNAHTDRGSTTNCMDARLIRGAAWISPSSWNSTAPSRPTPHIMSHHEIVIEGTYEKGNEAGPHEPVIVILLLGSSQALGGHQIITPGPSRVQPQLSGPQAGLRPPRQRAVP